jgi:hypothetical protein
MDISITKVHQTHLFSHQKITHTEGSLNQMACHTFSNKGSLNQIACHTISKEHFTLVFDTIL